MSVFDLDAQHSARAAQLAKDKAALWRAGKLRWKLHSDQKGVYDKYRAWEKFAFEERKAKRKLPGLYPRFYQFDCSRRYGKDYLGLLIRIEDCLRKPGGRFSYATAYQKDITSIVVPLIEQIIEDAPLDVKPIYKQAFQGQESGYFFPNGACLLLVGIERNPDGLRGRYSDGVTISEAGFVEKLDYVLLSVLMPMLQGRLEATVMLNSTPPEAPGTWYDTNLTEDCKNNGRYTLRTIMDNPLIDDAQRQEFIDAAGGITADRCRREYFCERIRSDDLVVLPEFNELRHVRNSETPLWALGFTVIDPGVRDLCAVITGYLDFIRGKLVIKRCWAKRNAPTTEVAAAIRELEDDVFKETKYWNGRAVTLNPYQRWSDTEARMILDLSVLHKLTVAAADKTDAEAALNSLRVALQQDKIEIDPAAKELIAHCTAAVWNKSRTSYERSAVYGHFDLLDALKYAWRMANPAFRMNPTPPAGWLHLHTGGSQYDKMWRTSDWKHLNSVTEKLAQILPKRRKSHTR